MSFDAAPVLAQLKDFQRATADTVFRRFYDDNDPVHRFLVADEVGLGKTLVARGVIAKTIEHLYDVVDRIDVIYVCSNAQIAKQNVRRLHVGGEHFEVADRLTMLPATAHKLNENKVNVVSFTPGTSFDLKGGQGTARERAVLRLVLRTVWGAQAFRSRGSMRAFQGGVQTIERFEQLYRDMRRNYGRHLDETLLDSFHRTLDAYETRAATAGDPTVRDRFKEVCALYSHPSSKWDSQKARVRTEFIGDLRNILARSCLDALEPDLIILDEFQRFKHLLAAPDSEQFDAAAELAHELFSYVDEGAAAGDGSRTRVLLLSATPYKMLTRAGDEDDDHHTDLVDTARFLYENDEASVEHLTTGLRDLRRGLLQAAHDGGRSAGAARDRVQADLRRVMLRTERLAATTDRSGMLAPRDCDGLALESDDVRRYVGGAELARCLGVYDPIEYWLSSPYLLNYMDGYKLSEEFDAATSSNSSGLAHPVAASGLLDWSCLRRYEPVDIDNARLRWLLDDTVGRGAWKLLWVPPSLPYLTPSGPYAEPELQGFTKRLLFSSWTLVPKAVATLLTFEAERRMVSTGGKPAYGNRVQDRQRRARLLDLTLSEGRPARMPVLAMLYPSIVLASAGDPLALAATAGARQMAPDRAVSAVADGLRHDLAHLNAAVAEHSTTRADDRPDERWYWAAPFWLDRLEHKDFTDAFFRHRRDVYAAFTSADPTGGGDGLREHIARASEAIWDDYPAMGRMPEDLADVLARMALAGPGVCALRALGRHAHRTAGDLTLRRSACTAAWGMRTLFNGPEVTELVRGLFPGEPYWRRVLDYMLAGNLQAVLDEYVHVLVEARGHLEGGTDDALGDVATAIHDAVQLRTVNYGVRRVDVDGTTVRVNEPERMRANFALRLSDERADDGSQTRVSEVRDAFNSPFPPFVLATTSAGQEGLDFHPFCHAIVHWNLPGNPVDLEQREGRVHRYKGHAVRKNLAATHADVGLSATGGDPWAAMFDAAAANRSPGLTEIWPYWVYPLEGGATIDRYVPAFPLSRDQARAGALQKAVALYRLAFGQPRQDDLLAYLAGQIDPDELDKLVDSVRIDLRPEPDARRTTHG